MALICTRGPHVPMIGRAISVFSSYHLISAHTMLQDTTRLTTLVVVLCLVASVSHSIPILSPITGNYYEKGLNTTYDAAQADCASRNGYLASVTSALEAEWITSTFNATSISYWISGLDSGLASNYNYTYSAGPQVGTMMYSILNERCYSYCPWAPKEPTFIPEEVVMTMDYGKTYGQGVQFNNVKKIEYKYAICEFSTMLDILSVPGHDDSISSGQVYLYLKAVNSSAIAMLNPASVTITSQSRAVSYSESIQPTNGNTVAKVALHAPYTGQYKLTYVVNGQVLQNVFQFQPPFISYVYPGNSVASVVATTIVGGNFGSDASVVKVYYGMSPKVECASVAFIGEGVITCTTTSLIVDMYPVSVIADGVETRSFKAPFYYKSTDRVSFYSMVLPYATLDPAVKYASQLTVGSMNGFLSGINSEQVFNFLNKSVPTYDNSFRYYTIHTGVGWSGTQWVYKYGPLKDTPFTVWNANVPTPDVAGIYVHNLDRINADANNPNRLKFIPYQPPTGTDPYKAGVLTQFTLTQGFSIQMVYLNTVGPSRFSLQNYGHMFSSVKMVVGDTTYDVSMSNSDAKQPWFRTVTIPGHGGAVPIGLSVTVGGFNFYPDVTITTVVFGGVTITPSEVLEKSISFTIPPGSGSTTISVKVGNLESENKTFTYQSPRVASQVPLSIVPSGGLITLVGTSFGADQSQISLEGHPSIPVTINQPHNSISFTLPPGTGSFTFAIIVNGLKSESYTIQYQDQVTISNCSDVVYGQPSNITINGMYFSGSAGLEVTPLVSIGGSDCPLVTYTNEQIVCTFAANVVINDNGDALAINVTRGQVIGLSYTFLYKQQFVCPSDCSSHGVCDASTGQCQCDNASGWSGSDCSSKRTDSLYVPPPPLPETGSKADIPGSASLSYAIGLQYIREVSTSGQVIRQIDTSSTHWTSLDSSQSSTRYFGTFINDNCTLDITFTVYTQSEAIKFAGESLMMAANSIKQVIAIRSWTFNSTANQLELVFLTNQTGTSTSLHTINKALDSDLTWYDVSTDESILTSRFARRIVTDGRITKNRVSLLASTDPLYTVHSFNSTILSAMTVPYFQVEASLDPNFSLLLRSKDQTSDESESSSNKWKVPVIVTCSVIGAIAIILTVGIITKKKLQGRRFMDVAMKRTTKL
eukprot:gene19147-22932_t